MSNSQSKKKRRSPAGLLLLALVLLSLTVGGVSAYLSMSSRDTTSILTNAKHPTVTVNGTDVTVTMPANPYGAYLRIAVDANWVKSGSVIPQEPAGAYSIDANNWEKIGDFYYYKKVITETSTLKTITINSLTAPADCSLVVNVAAQVIQAIGTTDTGNIPAVEAEWGVTKEQITGTN